MGCSNLVTRKQVEMKYGYCCASIYNKMKEGLFPKPIKIGFSSRWVEDEIDAVIRSRIAGWTDDEVRRLIQTLETDRAKNAPVISLATKADNTK